jgi:hypothetical protein
LNDTRVSAAVRRQAVAAELREIAMASEHELPRSPRTVRVSTLLRVAAIAAVLVGCWFLVVSIDWFDFSRFVPESDITWSNATLSPDGKLEAIIRRSDPGALGSERSLLVLRDGGAVDQRMVDSVDFAEASIAWQDASTLVVELKLDSAEGPPSSQDRVIVGGREIEILYSSRRAPMPGD